MNTRTKIAIDRIVGTPLVLAFNLAARILGATLRRDHSAEPGRVKEIAVAKFVGMGSILQATPAIAALRRHFPGARITLVTSKGNRALVEHLPMVDDAIYIADKGIVELATSTLRAVLALQRRRVDLYFDLEVYSAYATLVSLFSLARNRYGFYRSSSKFKHGMNTHLVFFNTRRPVRGIYLQLARAAGVPEEPLGGIGPIGVTPADREGLAMKLPRAAKAAGAGKLVVLNPNASDLLLERRWETGKFAELAAALVARGYVPAFMGSRDEARYVAEIIALVHAEAREGVIDASGKLSLGELFALFEAGCCTITNDTGPMHMSIALGRPTLCLFGPGDPEHYGFNELPYVRTIHHPIFCSPCIYEVDSPPCHGNNVCMKSITVAEVLEEFEALAGASTAPPKPPRAVAYSYQDGTPLGLSGLGARGAA